MKVVFFISFVFMVSCWSCRTQSIAPSIITKDSIVHDSVITSDTVFYVDPLFINSLFYCDSLGEIQRLEIANWNTKFDSLKKISPIVRTVFKIKKEAVTNIKKEYVVSKPIVVYKIHPITWVISAISLLVIFLCILYVFKYKK